MELMLFFLTIVFIFAPIIGVILSIEGRNSRPAVLDQEQDKHRVANTLKQKQCEDRVTDALRGLDMKSYVVFENLILSSRGNTPHTEIDQVVVSPYGIFCIETKSHHGSIYGYTTGIKWKQYLGGKEFDIINPLRQNYKHTSALEDLLELNLKAKIHSYAVFPNARSVKIDGEYVNYSIDEVMRKISRHKMPVYNFHDCERILKTLAYASSKRDELKDIHVEEVKAYLRDKVA
jgi:L-rhamnose mutarotase